MKKETSIGEVITQIEEIFNVLNHKLYNGELPTVAIRVQRKNHIKDWFTCQEAWQVGEKT